jgi:type VI secretion system secreted protein Hcp
MGKQDVYLQLEGIAGESKDDKKKDWLQLENYSFQAFGARDIATNQRTGRTQMSPLNCAKPADKATPKLYGALWKNQKISKATLVVRKAGKEQLDFLTYDLEDVYVTSIAVSGSAGEEAATPGEIVAFSYSKMTVNYKEQKSDGTLGGTVSETYDLKTAK